MRYFKFVILFFPFSVFSQSSDSTATYNQKVQFALQSFEALFKADPQFFNGLEEDNYNFKIIGHPYFEGREWKSGVVDYNGAKFKHASIMYNLLTDQLVVLHPNLVTKVKLHKSKVKSFEISGLRFINVTNADKKDRNGFYQLLADGDIKFLKQWKKTITETYSNNQLEREIRESKKYFWMKDSTLFEIKSKKSLIKSLPDRKMEIQTIIKENKIVFGKKRELAILKITSVLNAAK